MASRTPAQISTDIIAKLAVTAPGLSLGVGTPERKIVDAVAEAIAESQVDNYMISTQLDIDTKSGSDLEDFVGIFGFGRLQGTRATGDVLVSFSIPAVQYYTIAAGAQFFSSTNQTFTSTTSVTISVGDSIANIPLQCSVVGVVGNAPSASITGFSSGLGFSTVTNVEAFTGGTDNETDEQLRARFKSTLLRNIAGTEDFYSAICLQIAPNGNTAASGVSRVQVLGPVVDYTTQIQSGATSTPITLTSKNCKYVWSKGEQVSINTGSSTEAWFTNGTDYSWTTGAISAPVFTPLNSNTANQFLDIKYEYCSTNSRNDPISGKTNKIDIYVDGSNPQAVSEVLKTNYVVLNSTVGSTYNVANFASNPAGTTLVAGTTRFQRLGSTPILTWPTSLVLGTTTYVLGTDYVGVYDTSTNRGTEREVSGIVWITASPANGSSILANYTYNQTPQVLNAIFKKQKQITSDVLVHSAVNKYLRFYFVIMYNTGVSPSAIQPNIATALSNYINALSFGAWIQFSDLSTVIHNVPGVDNCRIAKVADGAPYSASEVVGGVAVGSPYTIDFQLEDDTIPVLNIPTHVVNSVTVPDYDAMFIRRSFNNFGS